MSQAKKNYPKRRSKVTELDPRTLSFREQSGMVATARLCLERCSDKIVRVDCAETGVQEFGPSLKTQRCCECLGFHRRWLSTAA